MSFWFLFTTLKHPLDHGYPDTARPDHRSVFRHGERLFHQRYLRRNFPDGKEEIASVKEDLLKKADVSKSMFGSSPEEDREFLQLFSFICLLSFDVYLKKQMIEHMVDELASLAAPSDPKKKN